MIFFSHQNYILVDPLYHACCTYISYSYVTNCGAGKNVCIAFVLTKWEKIFSLTPLKTVSLKHWQIPRRREWSMTTPLFQAGFRVSIFITLTFNTSLSLWSAMPLIIVISLSLESASYFFERKAGKFNQWKNIFICITKNYICALSKYT